MIGLGFKPPSIAQSALYNIKYENNTNKNENVKYMKSVLCK